MAERETNRNRWPHNLGELLQVHCLLRDSVVSGEPGEGFGATQTLRRFFYPLPARFGPLCSAY